MEIAKKARFRLPFDGEFLGYTLKEYWNGWDCPYFTFYTAQKVCKHLSEKEDNKYTYHCWYNEETDSFYYRDYVNGEEKFKIGSPIEINTEKGLLKVYYFGCVYTFVDCKRDEETEESINDRYDDKFLYTY